MTPDEIYLSLLSARLEFLSLTNRIVFDGRDPLIVAETMMDRLAKHLREYQRLWDAKEGK